jgi:hypothetical protein
MKRIAIIGAIVFAALAVTSSVGYAQQYTCVIINGVKCIVHLNPCGQPIDTVCPPGSNGSATFNSTTGPIPPVGAVNTNLNPANINISIPEPLYGSVTTNLDPTRVSPPSTLNSIAPPNRFPLRVRIRFYATATLATVPTKLYRSRTPLEFESNTATSVNPFNNETFTLSANVEYYDAADPAQATVFKLVAGTKVTIGAPAD